MKLPSEMNRYHFTASTPQATVAYTCEGCLVKTKYLEKFLNKPFFDALCEKGCPNYGNKWSCPPYAPDYVEFTEKYEYINVFVLCVELAQLNYIKQDYLKIKAANSILKSRIDKALRNSISEDEFYISTGSCRLCQKCKKKIGMPCSHPRRRTFSFEALGINVSLLAEELFNRELLWYKPGKLPKYTVVVTGLLSNSKMINTKVIDSLSRLK